MDFVLMRFTLLLLIIAPFLGALATFFTGFGLNTILVPVFMIYFDAPLAVLMAGIVHLCNNILKVALTSRSINWQLFRNFGIPALFFALLGAFLLNLFNDSTTINLKPIFGVIFMCFACLEFFNFQLPFKGPWLLRFGGVLSGFFGGFSGHQGALRALFLSKLKMEPIVFVATTALISLLVDLTRVSVYFSGSWFDDFYPTSYMFLSVPAALAGTLVGKKYIQKVNHSRMSLIVGIALFAMGLSMLLGSLTPFH
jgi:uncharacterized membrane protein YfcA